MDPAKREAVKKAIREMLGNSGAGHLWAEVARQVSDLLPRDLLDLIAEYSAVGDRPIREGLMQVFQTALELRLAEEQIAAQEKMSKGAEALQLASVELAKESNTISIQNNRLAERSNLLTWATVMLAIVAVVEAGIQIWQQIEKH